MAKPSAADCTSTQQVLCHIVLALQYVLEPHFDTIPTTESTDNLLSM